MDRMAFQQDLAEVCWRLRLKSPPGEVYAMLSSADGRARFWAESAAEIEGKIHLVFPNGQRWAARIIENDPPHRFTIEYIGGTVTSFHLADDGAGGTILTLRDTGVSEADRTEVMAGWVSVLLALKAAVDYGIDLRNHDPRYSWDDGFVDN